MSPRFAFLGDRTPDPAPVPDSFAEAWTDYAEAWAPVRRAMEQAAAAHEAALGELEFSRQVEPGKEGLPWAGQRARTRYRAKVAAEVLGPVHAALSGLGMATQLEAALHAAADGVRASLPELEAAEERRVERTLLAVQRRAFRASQRRRARWLGRLERAWHDWVSVLLLPPPERTAANEGSGSNGLKGVHVEAAGALQETLAALTGQIEETIHGSEDSTSAVQRIWRASADAVGRLGGNRSAGSPDGRRGAELARRWEARADETTARLALYREFLELRSEVDALQSRAVHGWRRHASAVEAVLDRFSAELDAGRQRALSLGDASGDQAGVAALLDGLRAEKERTARALQQVANALPAPDTLLENLTEDVEEAIRSLLAAAADIPEEFTVHDVPESGDRHRRPGGDARTVRLREATLQAFDALRIERIRAAPSVTGQAMDGIGVGVAQLCEVAAYGYEAAIAEVSEGMGGSAREQVGPVTAALSRAEERLREERLALSDAIDRAGDRLNREVRAGFHQLVRRVLADRLKAGYLDARSYLAEEVAEDLDRWRGRAANMRRSVTRGLQAGRRLLAPMVSVLGISRQAPADTAGRAVAIADEVVERLPVVYRRLFAFEPVTDPRLLAGREDALAGVSAAWERREAGDHRSLLVVAAPGAGITSFLNIASHRLAVAARHSETASPGVRGVFLERVREESNLAALLGGWLGIAGAGDLEELAGSVLEAPADALPPAVVLEGLEHLHMRVEGGAALFKRFMTFMSRTESRVFWVVGMYSSAWQLVEKRSASFAADLERMVLEELSSGDLREAILARHRLSGLPLRFAAPQRRQDILRRRARQLRGNTRQQQLIESDYFQRLHRTSMGSIRTAMFHWLRSADFETIEGSLLVKPLESRTPLMSGIDLSQSFALKALLDHGTLTVREYCEIARAPEREGFHLLRSLVDLHVIEATGVGSAADSGTGAPSRYRLRPLMTGAVAAHLRSLNILH